jgi:hypothetical protein
VAVAAYWNLIGRNLIGRSMTALPTVLSPSSILPPPSRHCPFVQETIRRAFKKCYFNFVYILRTA